MSTVVRLAVDNPPPAKAPAAPSNLGSIGKTEWRKVAPLLMRDGSLPPEVESLLSLYCAAVEGAQDAAKILRKQGRTFEGQNGLKKAHPMVRAEAVYLAHALQYAKRLGLVGGTPAGRHRAHDAPTSVFD